MITLGSVVHRELEVLDANGNLTDPSTVTLHVLTPVPADTDLTGSVTVVSTGVRAIDYVPAVAGRFVLKWRTTGPVTALDQEFEVVAAIGEPRVTLAEVKTYLGATSWSDPDLQAAIDAEVAAQNSVTRAMANYPRDLKEALFRRVARNLAMRSLPLAIQANDAGAVFTPGRDPEVRRLEAPWRRLTVG